MKRISLLFIIFITLYSCKKSDGATSEIPCNPSVSFAATVKPIFINNCAIKDCHDGNNMPAIADTYIQSRDNSPQIKFAVENGTMPKGFKLSATDKAAILCWIDNGSKNN
jgi:hypothetical protein